jgi:hypothetical protein
MQDCNEGEAKLTCACVTPSALSASVQRRRAAIASSERMREEMLT